MRLYKDLLNLGSQCLHRNVRIFYLQSQNLHILKRRHPIRKINVNARFPKPLMDADYEYEVVENTLFSKKPPLNVILTEYVEGLGQRGDLISLNLTKGRMLILLKQAVYASPENIEEFEQEKKDKPQEKLVHSSIYSAKTIRYLSKLVVPVIMSDEVPWTIDVGNIRTAFRLSGIILPETSIELPKEEITGPDIEKENKDFAVFVTINNLERVPVRCRLFHWTKDPDNVIPNPVELASELNEPLLEEQIELLSSNDELNNNASGYI